MARMKRARRAARNDPKYQSKKHTDAVHTRRLTAKLAKAASAALRSKKKAKAG